MSPFGSEQSALEASPLRRFALRLLGELHFGFRLRAHYLSMALKDVDRVERIFEAGCHRGQTSFWLSRRFPGARIKSVDIDPMLVAHCQKVANAGGIEHVQFRVADLTDYHERNAADLVVCFDVLEHIQNWQAAVRTLVDQLRPGGLLLIHSPQAGQYQGARFGLRKLLRRLQLGHSEHEHEGFVPSDFAILDKLGLDHRVMHTFGPWAMNLHTVFEVYRSHSRLWWLFLTPLLLLFSRLESPARTLQGGGLLVIARRQAVIEGTLS
jgi:SAM-dependent methyltransferase